MKVLKIDDVGKVMSLVPRVFPNEGDILVIKMRDEITNIESIINHTWAFTDNYFTVTLLTAVEDNFYKEGSKYELTILRNSINIYKGKVLIASNTVNIQDYQHATISVNKKLKF